MDDGVMDLACAVDLIFTDAKPTFGDLLRLCGVEASAFPTSGRFRTDSLVELQFEQVDDYFGIGVLSTGGVVIRMYPLIQGHPVEQHPGPFDGLRLDYDVTHHAPSRAAHFALVIGALAALNPCTVCWTADATLLEQPIRREVIRRRIARVLRSRTP
jgi:hypothetical protein